MPKPYTPNDKWSQRAAAEGYRARSVYKLMELDERFGLLKPGMTVLDLGAAPGSWLQYTSQQIGPEGRAIGLDLAPIEPIGKNVETLTQDITDLGAIDRILQERSIKQVDLILSDIAPNTSGIKDVDQWRSVELNQSAVAIAEKWLKPGGRCVLKIFRGADFDEFLGQLKRTLRDVRIVTVKASRNRSREVYLVMKK
ncbi:RlmE family RNA methyltransferase [Candidatus Peregrinibacteria bacterium]|nr:RlmE family RNA methyltransferase [Candidatus Peregrinibacteria bacterium]